MTKNYDNWERLVTAVLRKERDKQTAMAHSRNTSCSSSSSSSSFLTPTSHCDDDYQSLIVRQESRELAKNYSASEVFLPSDWSEILSRSVSPVVYATKKELSFTLCHSPILLDGGKLSFSLEKKSGKKCYMIGARELAITWGDTPKYRKWTSCSESRFSEIAHLQYVWWLDIRGKINTQMLSWNTTYGAYLVFNLSKRFYGLESANAVVRFVDREARSDAESRASVVHIRPRWFERRTGNGWIEIELGSFYNGKGDDGEVEARLMEIKQLHLKSGLLVQGIQFRPKT